ncbi:MAG: acyl-CoA thioesterase [Spirochaetes bacterium]|nr:acyl-CoA thioesterase [Spirochaetota bacterium]
MPAYEKPVVVRMHHTDAAGILFFGKLFELADEVLEEAMEHCGLPPGEALRRGSELTPVVHAEGDYKRPMFLGSRLTARARIEAFGNTSLRWRIDFVEAGGEVAATVGLVQVLVSRKNGRKLSLSKEIREKLGAILEPAPAA